MRLRFLAMRVLLVVLLLVTPEVAVCGEPCPDDETETCSPECTDCVCCPHVPAGALDEVQPSVEQPHARVVETEQRPPLPPEPGDIVHVPIVRSA